VLGVDELLGDRCWVLGVDELLRSK